MAVARIRPLILVIAALLVAAPTARASAGLGAWVRAERADLRLVSAVDSIAEGRATVRLGLHVRLDDGWKLYWRSPGTAGLPPEIDWQGSDNLAEARILWPAPKRFVLFGLQSFGYESEVVLPIEARLKTPGTPAVFRAEVSYLVCREICVPGAASVALGLGNGEGAPSAAAHLIGRFLGRVPAPAEAASVAFTAQAGAGGLTVTARAALPFTAPDLFVEAAGAPDLPAPAVSLAEGGRVARFRFAGSALPAAESLRLTLVDGGLAVEGTAVVARGAAGLGPILLLALAGGLILNLMPCVLPVLAMKASGVAALAGRHRGVVRAKLVATAAGVLGAMVAVGAALAVARAAGAAVGWGVQFQEPLFLAFMAAVTALFAYNLWGLFSIPAPAWAGMAADAAPKRGLAGDVATGAFATLLATPCSAPFVGTAAAWALSRGPGEILAVFVALGLGLAAPWILFALMPAAIAWLPRPGHWMLRLRLVLGLLLAGTSVWLLSVLAAQVGATAALSVGAMLVVAGVVLALARGRRIALPAAGALAVAAVALPLVTGVGPATRAAYADATALAFAPEELADRARAGEVVLVDITADWCVTCQVNKALVLNRGQVAELLKHEVRVMRGDWTRPDPRIAAFLAAHGRVGIPFNAVYGPGAPQGIVLPELLTESAVLEAIAQAQRRDSAASLR
ncbi:MAG: protein-disulfide reductase DsbD family protein [Elioraea sp.]|nr:protein-disulfide reductase DsbD family protein [Elioraea sp.]